MRNTIKTLLVATALAAGGTSLAMAQSVPVDATELAPDTEHNTNVPFAEQDPINTGYGYNGGYRGRAMLGGFGSPYTNSAWSSANPWISQQIKRDSDLQQY